MHPLLQRQLKRYYAGDDVPDEMRRLLDAIDQAYRQNDQDRELLERSLEISSTELNERYEGLEEQLRINEAEKHHTERALSMLDATFEAIEEGIVVADPTGTAIQFNEIFTRIWGLPRDLLNTQGANARLDAIKSQVLDPESFVARIREVYADPTEVCTEIIELKDGRVLERYTSPQLLQGVYVGRVWSFRDITERRAAERRLGLARSIFEASTQGILVTDPALVIVDANQALCSMLELEQSEIVGGNLLDLRYEDQGSSFNENLADKLRRDGEWWGELRTRNTQAMQVIWINFSTVYNDHGRVANYVGMFTDVTKLKEVEEQLQQLAYYDSLTGLPNRRLFKERVERYLQGSRRSDRNLALLYLDLDRFKFVNDSLGHLAGDQLLKLVAERIQHEVRDNDLVSRLGGDEFTIALISCSQEKLVGDIARRIVASLNEPFRLKDQEVYIGASIGICMLPSQAADFEEGTRKADVAMYLAKAAGKGRYCFWDKETQAAMEARILIETDLREAPRRDQFMVHYQPIVNTSSRHPVGFEALLRWQHPNQGLIPPGRFIPIAEEIGMISEVGIWVINAVCRQLRAWQDDGVPVLPVSINVSARHLDDARLHQQIVDALQTYRIDPRLLSIEITESTAMSDPATTIAVLRKLKTLGVQSAIDDFGTGYSSLSYLKQLPADTLKIDRSFVHDITSDPNDRGIAKAIIDLGHSLSMKITAEGVEDAEQLAILEAMGCEQLQGWLFAKAMPADDVTRMLLEGELPARRSAGQ